MKLSLPIVIGDCHIELGNDGHPKVAFEKFGKDIVKAA
jgi:hypothetical protein